MHVSKGNGLGRGRAGDALDTLENHGMLPRPSLSLLPRQLAGRKFSETATCGAPEMSSRPQAS